MEGCFKKRFGSLRYKNNLYREFRMYGIYLSIHPAEKYVMIHQKLCPSFKQNEKVKHVKHIFTFNKKAKTLREAIETASEYSLEWHAPISFCLKCFPSKNKIECTF